MRRREKPRDIASDALIALRTAMGLTQQDFAVKVMDNAAVSTIGRWETHGPPRGDTLLRFAQIADEQARVCTNLQDQLRFLLISGTFKKLYLDDMREEMEGELILLPKVKGQR